jgi:hypothetical protein
MQIEIVEYYPAKSSGAELKGSLHVFLPELGIDVRGILCRKTKNGIRIVLPSKFTADINDESVRFPAVVFRDSSKHIEFIKEIIKQAEIYIDKMLKEAPKDVRTKANPDTRQTGLIRPRPLDKRTGSGRVLARRNQM